MPEPSVTMQGTLAVAVVPITPSDITTQKTQHDGRLRKYNKFQAIETSLKNQLTNTLSPYYAETIRNDDTDIIAHSMPTIFAYLEFIYGQITFQELCTEDEHLMSLV